MAASGLIAQEAGARLFGIHGEPWTLERNGVLAFSPNVAEAILPIIREMPDD